MIKTIRSVLAFGLLASLFMALLPVEVLATPQTHPNTHVNTGDQRADIVAVALTQVGYREGPNNDTKYGVWYGYNNLGWCGIFVAWCANQAGVPTSVLARTGVASPSAYGLTAEPDGYVPLPGDLFFSKDHSHVGLVYYVDGDYFYSLEGNTWENGPEGVYTRRHKRSNVIFASPAYQGGGNHTYVLSSETAHPHREYYKCTDCGDQYYTGKNQLRGDCITCVQSSCAHSYSNYSTFSDSQHKRSCTKCGKEDISGHGWNSGVVTKAPTCSSTGTKDQTCNTCGATRMASIPKTGDHSYGEWAAIDEISHRRTCRVCGIADKKEHDQTPFETNETDHWRICKTCGLKTEEQAHQYTEKCDAPCDICGYSRPEGHPFENQWSMDDDSHWIACGLCGLQKDQDSHVFSEDCDESCDTCGYTRATEHSFSIVWTSDETNHWFECTVCGQEKDIEPHVPEKVSRKGAIQHCTVCERVITAESDHIHGFDEVFSGQNGHWGKCSCGLSMELQAHQWSVRTEQCSVCGHGMPNKQVDYSDLIPWIVGVSSILLFGIVLIVLVLRRKK